MPKVFSLRPSVVLEPLGDGGVALLDISTRNFFTLNATGKCIVDGLKAGATETELAAQVSSTFDVPQSESIDDVRAFLAVLLEHSLVQGSA